MSAVSQRHASGYALLLVLVVLLAGSLYGIASRLDAVELKSRQTRATYESLALAREALLAYAATYGDLPDRAAEASGYLPCPDTLGNGVEQPPCSGAGQSVVGLLPYKTLGLPDLRDAGGNCLWYAVSGAFKNSPKASPMNWDTQGRFTVIDNGAVVTAPDDANGGAAAVVFAPGPALAGQTRSVANQPCGAAPAEVAAYLESAADTFVQGATVNDQSMTANNDRLTWVTSRDIFRRIVARADFRNPLGTFPEGRINRLIDASRQSLESKLWSDMAAQSAASSGLPAASAPSVGGDYVQHPGKLVGELPDLKPLAFGGTSYDTMFDNWRDQFRYVVCDNLKTAAGCLTFGAQACRAALLFAGQAKQDAFPFGGPRPSTQKPSAPLRSASLSNYFEAGGGLDLLVGTAQTFYGPSAYADSARDADVGTCLGAGGYATFAKDIAAVTRVASSVAHPEVVVDTAAARITLGNTAATAAGRGCAWLPTPLPFNTSLRAYFTLRIADLGEGIVFAIVDAAGNQAALTAGTLCGGTTGALLGYAGGNIAPPKFGLELDTRAQTGGNCSGSNRNDPSAHHMAFVYWGSTASTADDNCHGAGTVGSGAQPLNPRTLTGMAGIKTVQSSDPHLPYAGVLPLDTDIHVRLDVAKGFDAAPIQSASWSAATGSVTVATFAPHGLLTGQRVTISGGVPTAYNGTYAITVGDATHFAYQPGADPGIYVSGGRIAPPLGVTVQAANWAAGRVTVTTVMPHGFTSGQPVSIAGAVPGAYNGTYPIAAIDATHFSYALAGDPGAYGSGGTLTPAIALTLKAYVASQLEVFSGSYLSTCNVVDLRNLSADLDALCTQRASIEQDDIYIDADAATGRALAAVLAGFTTAQSTGGAGTQSLTISNFVIRTQ